MSGGETTQDQSKLLAYLCTPGVLTDAPVKVIPTSTAYVLLAGRSAYKLRRAIRYSYLDYSVRARRDAAALAELTLNRRTAPDLYLGLLPVAATETGFRLRPLSQSLDRAPHIVEHLVAMRRFDETATLDQCAADGRLTQDLVERLAAVIARFHMATLPTYQGAAAAKLAQVSGRTMRDLLAARVLLGADRVVLLHQAMQAALIQAMSEVDERGAAGHFKRLHGDLHLGNVALIDGAPVIFDALEFDDAMATVDELHDVAFLIMDLWVNGQPEFAGVAWSRYLAERDDYSGLALAPLYIAMRAAVRAKVAMNASRLLENDVAAAERRAAAAYVKAAAAALQRPAPRLIAIGGLSGAGKTTLARALAPDFAPAFGAIHLRSDLLRKHRAGVPFEAPAPASAYSETENRLVYEALLERAGAIIKQGGPVIVDAVFAKPEERQAAVALAARLNVPFTGLWLDLDLADRQRRIAGRSNDASDATAAVAARQADYDLGAIEWHRIDAASDAVSQARALIHRNPRDQIIQS